MKLSPQVCKQLFPEQLVEKISHLASGRMGSVYKVTLSNGEILCVKILTKNHPTKHIDSEGWQLAYKDLEFDFKTYEDNKHFYFTIPYFRGELFHSTIRYNLKSRFEIIKCLIEATKKIHEKGIIHRDIKCNNIIDEKNKVHIIDFGRSVIFHDSSTEGGLQLPDQGILFSEIKSSFQPYTAPEYFKKNNSSIGFYSDYYSIAQLFRFLIPEYSNLATEVLTTEGEVRKVAFEKFYKKIKRILKDNQFNQKFNEADKIYSNEYILYKRLIFFIREIFYRLFNLSYQDSDSTFKKNTEHTKLQYVGPILFKQAEPNTTGTLSMPLPRTNTNLYK